MTVKNDGSLPLVISNASADASYTVNGDFPLTIAPQAYGNLSVTAPAPTPGAKLGAMSSGTLSFTSNEPGHPTHRVTLNTTLFGGSLELLDENGDLLTGSLTLGSPSSAGCPDSARYRVHNTGNLAFQLSGPTFPAHLGGTSTGSGGVLLEPDGYTELQVGGVSLPGNACSAEGTLTFTVDSGYCGTPPSLKVTWPAGSLTSCACVAPAE